MALSIPPLPPMAVQEAIQRQVVGRDTPPGVIHRNSRGIGAAGSAGAVHHAIVHRGAHHPIDPNQPTMHPAVAVFLLCASHALNGF